MDMHFKILRAEEEIGRLQVEIPRFITQICDEEEFLMRSIERLKATDQVLAYHIGIYRTERSRFNSQHMKRFVKLVKDTHVRLPMTRGRRKRARPTVGT